jgi:hypothetical protein
MTYGGIEEVLAGDRNLSEFDISLVEGVEITNSQIEKIKEILAYLKRQKQLREQRQ